MPTQKEMLSMISNTNTIFSRFHNPTRPKIFIKLILSNSTLHLRSNIDIVLLSILKIGITASINVTTE